MSRPDIEAEAGAAETDVAEVDTDVEATEPHVPDALPMHVWADADAFPVALREMVFKAAARLKVPLTLVANRPMTVPKSHFIKSICVPIEPDAADHYIAARAGKGDLVLTADIPLAAAAVEKGAIVLNFRGDLLTASNVTERLSIRDFMSDLRDSGVDTGGPKPFGPKDKQKFAGSFDSTLSRLARDAAT